MSVEEPSVVIDMEIHIHIMLLLRLVDEVSDGHSRKPCISQLHDLIMNTNPVSQFLHTYGKIRSLRVGVERQRLQTKQSKPSRFRDRLSFRGLLHLVETADQLSFGKSLVADCFADVEVGVCAVFFAPSLYTILFPCIVKVFNLPTVEF